METRKTLLDKNNSQTMHFSTFKYVDDPNIAKMHKIEYLEELCGISDLKIHYHFKFFEINYPPIR